MAAAITDTEAMKAVGRPLACDRPTYPQTISAVAVQTVEGLDKLDNLRDHPQQHFD